MREESDNAIVNLRQKDARPTPTIGARHLDNSASSTGTSAPQAQKPPTKVAVRADHAEKSANDSKQGNAVMPTRWEAYEYPWAKKSKNWYAAFVLATGLAITAFILLKNLSAIMVVAVGGAVVLVAVNTPPKKKKYGIAHNGIFIEDRLYEFIHLQSFWIHEPFANRHELVVHSKKSLGVDLKIPLEGQDPEKIKALLVKYIPVEKEPEERLSDAISRIVGI